MRTLLIGCAVAFCAVAPLTASAQDTYPNRPVKIIVPFAAGAFPDTVARLVGEKMAEGLGQPVVVENRVGAGGNIGTEAVVRAAPDGYTLLLHTVANVINKSLYRKLSFDAQKDLTPIGQIAAVGNVLVASPQVPANTLPELIALSRNSSLSFASGGNGTTAHLAGQLLKTMAKIPVEHVPYSNFGQAMTEVIAGQPQFVIPNLPPTVQHIKSGRLKALAVTSAKRSTLLPDVPTFAEAGLPGYEVSSWNGLAAPARTPPEIINRLSAELAKALNDPEVMKKLAAQGADIVTGSPAAYAAFIDAETVKWSVVVKEAGAQVD